MNHPMHGTYDVALVVFSYVVAVVASYTVLDLAGRVSEASGRSRWLWLSFGALAMGLGIWSMHFVGMMAYTMPLPVAYDLAIVLLSFLAAVASAFVALFVVSRKRQTPLTLFGGGLLLAIGISSMHYIGMAAMLMRIRYDPPLFALSIAIALFASIAALWLSLYFRKGREKSQGWLKLGAGIVMGAAIAGMHYTGMAAARFREGTQAPLSAGMVLDQRLLAYYISGAALLTMGLSLFGIYISRRLSSKDSEIRDKTKEIFLKNQELQKLNDHLEELVRERTAQLEKAHDEAIRANRVKSQFLANMSHELRTPLNAIIGYSEMLEEDAADMGEPMFAEDLGKISKAGKQLLALINDILDISKIEAGKMDVYNETCLLPDVIADVIVTVKPLIASNGNRLETRLADGELTTDAMKLKQILINLLSNASKFTKDGKISLDVKKESRGEADGYAFTVKDTGIGMTQEQMQNLFQPFTQADSSTTRQFGGTGLGLAISQRFSQLLGGDIRAESEFGAGSVFVCWIPRQPYLAAADQTGRSTVELASESTGIERSARSEYEPALPAEAADGSRLANEEVSILVIDDEPASRDMIRRCLTPRGWTLAFAENGAEGLELTRRLRPEVICLDIQMPNMDGWSVLRELKGDPELRDIPVVILTMIGDRRLGYSLGASEFLTKPVQREQLAGVLDKYVGKGDRRVLLVEDDEAAGDWMTRMLGQEGFAVTRAVNGRRALAILEKETPRLIVLDLMMPEMNGFEFVAELRKREAWRDIPVVVLTSRSVTAAERIMLSGYVNGIVQKGALNVGALLEELESYLTISGKEG